MNPEVAHVPRRFGSRGGGDRVGRLGRQFTEESTTVP